MMSYRIKDANSQVEKRYIYHLVDPRNGEVFYVGQTTNPGQRLQEHAKVDAGKNKVARVKEILLSGSYPVMKTIMTVTGTYQDALAIEKDEISKFPYSQLMNGKGAK
jgi:hypothetical protein